jgi:adenylate cyclase
MASSNIRSIVDWLVDGARSTMQAHQVLAELCDRLIGCGIPLWRVAVFVRTLHPHIMGRRFIWRPGVEVEVREAPFDLLETAEFRGSPVAKVYASGVPIRRRLADADCPIDFPMLRELRDEGVSDYLASPLLFTDGEVHLATWTTRQAGGFTEAQINGIESIVAPLARVAEVRALRRTASNLLDTYVGNNAGERILAGQIRRGHAEAIYAAIWLSDMRGFTSLADRLPPQTLIELLNAYFDCQVPAILKHGGEVLKFMGDGLLAIFPIKSDSDPGEVCARALAAAYEARGNVAALNRPVRIEIGVVRFGLALHIGKVLYGNIGGGNRLDFTCIGPAVNLAARLEKLAAKLGRVIVASDEFARHCGADFQALGKFPLTGFASEQNVFGAPDEASSPVSTTSHTSTEN